jgi:hypothetical protein
MVTNQTRPYIHKSAPKMISRILLISYISCIVLFGPSSKALGQSYSKSKTERPTDPKEVVAALYNGGLLTGLNPEKEVVELRSETTKHFRNEDGTMTAIVGSGPLHYEKDGKWHTVLSHIFPNNSGAMPAYRYAATYNRHLMYFPERPGLPIVTKKDGLVLEEWGNPALVWLDAQGNVLSEVTANPAATATVTEGDIVYPDIFPGIDAVMFNRTHSKKLNYVLKNAGALANAPAGAVYLSFRETVRTEGGLTVTQDHAADTRFSKIRSGHVQGDVLFTDSRGEAVFKVHAPVFHDIMKGGECTDPGFDTTALNDDAYIEGAFLVKDKGNGELHVNLLVPMDWATAAHRRYPLTIDPITNFYPVAAITNVQWPTFTVFRGGNSGGYGCNTGQYAGRQYPASDISYGWVDTTWPVSNPYLYGYATFDISAIPNNACILSADYNWYRYGGRTCGDAIRLKFGMVAGNADLSLPTTCDPLGNAILNNNAYYNGTGKNGNGWQNQAGNTNDVVSALPSNRITMGWAYNGGDDCCTFACGGNDGAYHNVYGFEQPTLKPYVRINYETPSVAPLNINSSQPSACIGQNTTLAIAGGTLGSGATWRWYAGSCGGTLVGTGPSITVSPNATTNYFVRAEGGCGNTSCVSITLFVNEVPGLTANPNSQTICTGTPVNINLSSNLSGTAFSWTAAATGPVTGQGAGNGNQIGQLLTNFGTVSGTVTYTVTATKDGCSSAPISIPVTVNPVPSGSATVLTNPICGGNPTNITLNSNQPGTVFNWVATGSSDLSGFGPGSGTSINQVIENTGTFSQVVTYTITPVLGSCTGASFQTFQSVLPAPTVNISTTTPSFCSGGNAFVNISPSSGTVSWTATGSPNATGFTASGSGTSIIQTLSTSDAAPATVTYTATASDGGCTGSPASTFVTILPPPTGGITGTTAICSGEPATLTFDLPSGTGPYNVVYNPGNQSLFGIEDGHTVTVWPSSNTTYSLVSITDANGCVRNSGFSSTATVTIGLPPNGTANPGSVSFCSGGTTSINLSGDQPGTTFTWTASAGSGSPSGFSNGSGNSISQTLTNPGPGTASVMYLVTPALGTCTGSPFPVMATVRPIPTLTPNATEQTICSGQQTNITFTPNPPTATSAWTVSVDPGIGNHAPGNGVAIQQTLTNTSLSEGIATYTVTPVWGTGVNQCLGEPFDIPVTVNVIPTITTTPSTQVICTGAEANIGISSPVTGTSFSWTSVAVGGATGHSGGAGNNISQTLTNNATTVGTVTYTINASVTGCTASSVNATVTVNPRPNATLSGISPICFGEGTDITLNASPGVGPFDITLTDGTDTYDFAAVANGGSVPMQPDATTTYSLVSLSDNSTGCERTSGFSGSMTVTVNPLPSVSMDGIASSYCESDADAIVSGNQGSAGNFSGWSGLVANPDGTVTFSPSQAGPGGPYNVSYTYTDGNGCTDVASVDVTVDAQPTANGGSDAFVCDALTHTLNATPSAFFGGWTATGPGTAAFSDVLSAASSVDVSEAGVYEFNWIVVNGDCSASDTVEVTFAEPEAEPTTACYETAIFNTTTCVWDVTGTQPAEPATACYETATFNTTTCIWDVTGDQPAEPTTACYETATFNTTTCVWDVTGTQPAEPTTACYETATFNTTICVWDVTGTQPTQPTTACYETASFNTITCVWDVTGDQPAEPTTACYETAAFNTTTCVWDVTGDQPAEPTTACYETATFNTTTCAWDVTGTQPAEPTTACYETATFNTMTCAWDVTGDQPAEPTTACYETATFNTTTCVWEVTGDQPAEPTTACYETAIFNTTTCVWDVTGDQPAEPITACYETATFNTTTCVWDVTGDQPAEPTTACYETATFNTTTCAWDVTGDQPAEPTTACYETATFNTTTCAWDVTGDQPAEPTVACYETATFNTTTCVWDVTGDQPAEPTVACYETATFNTTTCVWDVTGDQPAEPTTACYETTTFNTTTCAWDVIGDQPAEPTTACFETATFNTTTCAWDVTGTQPAEPTTACYETATFNTMTCAWDVTGDQPAEPTTACYETATFNTTTCVWEVTGDQPAEPTTACYETAIFNSTTCAWDVTGDQPAEPTTACYETATFNTTTCVWDVTGDQPAEPTVACYETATFNTTTCVWDVTGDQPAEPTTACYETTTFNTTTCAWDVIGDQPAEPTTACFETATFNTTTCAWDVTGTQPAEPTTACYETATFNTMTCVWDVTGDQPAEPTTACYETATFNATTCVWDVTGTQPASSIEETVCGSYEAPDGAIYTTSGDFTAIVQNAAGCDSIISIDLTVIETTENTTTESVCDSYTWSVNGQTYTESGTYTFVEGCNTETLLLTVSPSTTTTVTESACDSYTWSVNATTYTESGSYTFTNECGTQILDLTIAPSSTVTTNEAVCDSYTWSVNGQTYTESGTYSVVNGCETQELVLTVTPSTTTTVTESACDSYTWSVNATTYTESGSYTFTNECGTQILDLTIAPSSTVTTNEAVCDSYTWSVNGQTYTESGTYSVVNGCETQELVLTVTPSTTTTVTESACDSYTWSVNATTYTESGSYTFTNECGTQILDLTIAPSSTVTTNEAVCDSYTWSVNGQTYTESGTYSVVNGCETQELVLTVSPSTTTTVTESACDSYTWSVDGITYTESGSYTFTNDCGTQILDLTITPSSTVTTTEAVCDSYIWSVNGQTYTQSGTYTVVNGCETQELVLTVTPSTTTTVTESACDSYTWSQNGQVYSESGTYTVVSGCETHVLELTIGDEVTVSISGISGSYCATDNNQYTLVGSPAGGVFNGPGVTGNVFSPSAAGAGSHTISYDYSDPSGCTGYGEIVVEIGASLQVTMSGLGSMYCTTSQPVQMSGSPAGGVFSGPGVSGNMFSPSVAGQGSHVISYMFEDDFGCMGTATQNVNVSNVAAPVITAGGSTSFCAGQTVTLTASSGYQDYQWSNNQSGQSITVSNAGNITVTATHPASGCQATSEPMMVTVNPNPTVNLGQNVTICPGGSTAINAGNPGATYSWTPGGETTQQITVSDAGQYNVTVTDGNGCSGSGQVTVSLGSSLFPVITTSGSTTFCEGSSLVLNANSGYATYTWSTSATSQTISVNTGGTYTVTVTDGSGCSGSASITVSTVPAPNPTIISNGSTVICQGTEVSLSVTAGFSSYSWNPGGQTTQTINVTSAGAYSVTVTNANGCSGTSNIITVTSGQTVQPTIVASGPLEFCQGGSVTLTVEPAFASYAWNSGQTSQSITVTSSGSYAPTVTDANGCQNSSLLDNPVVVTVTNPQPIIEQDGNLLTVTNGPFASYQWFINNNPVPGATSGSFMPGESGNIKVTVTDANGCQGTSWNYEFTFVGITDANSPYGIKVYPNPNSGVFTIEAELGRHTDVTLDIRDLLGRELMTSERIQGSASFRRDMDMSHLANGTYMVRVIGKEGVAVLRVVKQ